MIASANQPNAAVMSDRIAPVAPETNVRAAIQRAADRTGVNFDLLVQTARRESALNASARAGTSTATGLFQFIDSTWLDMVRRHGAAHGLGQYAQALQRGGVDAATRADILALRTDPELSACMAGELARENASALASQLGRAPSAGELYAAHVLGAGGAVRLIQAAQQGVENASALFPREAAANRGIFYASGQPCSAQAVLDRLNLDASANVDNSAPQTSSAEAVRTVYSHDGMMSPVLAQTLFNMALLPLLSSGSAEDGQRQNDPLTAFNAYARSSQT
ncbi:MAG: lytic transglycosylase domain-containing protein [Proteobacteria bacterium]|nr:lytic transglycosylase domain-containing protein [Pseudomonadota bacterium]